MCRSKHRYSDQTSLSPMGETVMLHLSALKEKAHSQILLAATVLVLCTVSFSFSADWSEITLEQAHEATLVNVNESNESRIEIEFKINSFLQSSEDINGEEYINLKLEDYTLLFIKGEPALPRISKSIMIPDDAGMGIKVVKSEHRDFPNMIRRKYPMSSRMSIRKMNDIRLNWPHSVNHTSCGMCEE